MRALHDERSSVHAHTLATLRSIHEAQNRSAANTTGFGRVNRGRTSNDSRVVQVLESVLSPIAQHFTRSEPPGLRGATNQPRDTLTQLHTHTDETRAHVHRKVGGMCTYTRDITVGTPLSYTPQQVLCPHKEDKYLLHTNGVRICIGTSHTQARGSTGRTIWDTGREVKERHDHWRP